MRLKRPFAVFPWNCALTSPELHPWLRQAAEVTEVLVHVDDHKPPRVTSKRGLDAPAEFFVAPNHGFTVENQIRAAISCGHFLILTIDNHHGNGRDEDGGSATGAGRYHEETPTDGGVGDALENIFRWPRDILEHVIAIQLLNEPKAEPWNGEWAADFLVRYAHKIRARGWKILLDPNAASYADRAHFDWIDPHPLWTEPENVEATIRDLKKSYPNKEIVITELLDSHYDHTHEIIEAAIRAGAYGYSAFAGNRQDFPGDYFEWNGRRRRPAITLNINDGFTIRGNDYNDLRGIEDVDPEPDKPPVPEKALELYAEMQTLAIVAARKVDAKVEPQEFSEKTLENIEDHLKKARARARQARKVILAHPWSGKT